MTRKEYMRSWRNANRLAIREYRRKWRENNRDCIREYDRTWRSRNRAKVAKSQAKYWNKILCAEQNENSNELKGVNNE